MNTSGIDQNSQNNDGQYMNKESGRGPGTGGYEPEYTDFELSPYTGMTRESFKAAGRYLLSGVFNNIKDIDAPVVMPRAETVVTYPHENGDNADSSHADEGTLEAEKRAEIFEGLARSFFIASVLIEEDPGLTLNGISVRDYYKLHILRTCTEKDSSEYAGSYEEMLKLTGSGNAGEEGFDPFRPFQQTVETCALVIGLYMSRRALWERLEKEERDAIADFLYGYAHANTVPQNWRLFNMLDMAFLKLYGYEINESIMLDHAQAILAYYAGDGWYRDGHSFDYYSCWAFNMYAPLWNLWYGYEHMPEIAARFEENSNRLMETYPDMFDEDGFTNMWGRSCIYRNASTSPFDGNLFLKKPAVDMGLARRITAGSLLQFITRDDLLINGIPSLGFYGQFTPLVQRYSCAESPFWLGKAFLCLHLPGDHPFWTARENNGTWEGFLKTGDEDLKAPGSRVKETVLEGPALVFTNHEGNGETVLRTAKVLKDKGDVHGMWNYSKLCYNTRFPWESGVDAGPSGDSLREAPALKLESQQYVLRSLTDLHTERANVTFYAGSRDGVLYRRQFFDYDLATECHWLEAVDLADFPVGLGIMRADRFRICKRPVEIYLGSYGFPDNSFSGQKTEITTASENGAEAVIIKGFDHTGRPRRMAMTVYTGFDRLWTVRSRGTNPDSEYSCVIFAGGRLLNQYDAKEPYVFISQVITKDRDEEFKSEELFPIMEIRFSDRGLNGEGSGAYGPVSLLFKDGSKRVIDYSGIEGRMTL